MYSQYSYYQPQQHYQTTGGGGETALMAPSSTSYEQAAVSVPSGTNSTSHQFSNYSHSQPQQTHSWNQTLQQQQPQSNNLATAAPAPPAPPAPPNETAHPPSAEPKVLVEQYSRYYQYWNNQATQEAHAAATSQGQEKDEAARREAWARYYVEQSSRCAHHYNNMLQQQQNNQEQVKPTVQTVTHTAPPQATPEKNSGRSRDKRKSRWSQPAAGKEGTSVEPTSAPGEDESLPEGLKQYAHRCLSRCNSEQQKEHVQKSLETVIASALHGGTMHSTDWERKELIPLPFLSDERVSSMDKFTTGSAFHNLSQPSRMPAAVSSMQDREFGNRSARRRDDSFGSDSRSSSFDGGSNKSGRSSSNAPRADSEAGYYGPSRGNSARKDKFQAKDKKMADNYESRLPENESYYGSQPSDKNSVSDDYISLLPENDSYFGSQSNGSPSSKKRKQKKNNSGPAAKKKKQKKNSNAPGNKAKTEAAQSSGFERSRTTLAKRANRFSGRGGITDAASSSQSDAGANFERFMGKSVIGGSKKQLDEIDYEQMTVKGTCQKLEKEYLRLTAPPRAEAVRPQPVLEEHIRNLKKLWGQRDKEDNSSGEAGTTKRDYTWFCSQLKAVRQDLTVQRINNAFAVDVYETHARIGLEMSDLNEYNQCQTQLKELYELLSHDPKISEAEEKGDKTGLENYCEFVAYRIIYYVFLMGNKKYEGGSSDLFKIMLGLTPQQRENPCIAHALNVRVAVAEYDYHSFFRLQDSCPKMGAYLMDYLVPSVRHAALQRICRSYRPAVETLYVLSELGFEVDINEEHALGKEWLQSCGCKLSDDGSKILTKESTLRESDMSTTKSSLI